MALSGLMLCPDSTPLSSTLAVESGLVDGAKGYADIVKLYWNGDDSYGVDLGEEKEISVLTLYATFAGDYATETWFSTVEFTIFKSDNNSSWTSVEVFTDPPLTVETPAINKITYTLATPASARYWKITKTNAGYAGTSPGGATHSISEIGEFFEIITLPKIRQLKTLNPFPLLGGV